MPKINPKRSEKFNKSPLLIRGQKKLPDELQAKIIGKKAGLSKTAGGLEGRMIKRQLADIADMSSELLHYMNDHDDVHEWVQSKIATIHDRMNSVHSFVMYEKRNPRVPHAMPSILGTHIN